MSRIWRGLPDEPTLVQLQGCIERIAQARARHSRPGSTRRRQSCRRWTSGTDPAAGDVSSEQLGQPQTDRERLTDSLNLVTERFNETGARAG
ncbi:MAG: hypothetical protein U0992_21060 [Planctomycetaceae bacterium]